MPAWSYIGMSQSKATKGPQVLVYVSICQGSILGTYFWPIPIFPKGGGVVQGGWWFPKAPNLRQPEGTLGLSTAHPVVSTPLRDSTTKPARAMHLFRGVALSCPF